MFLRIAKLVPATGFVFAALVVIATAVTSGSPDAKDSDASLTSYYADAANRHKEEVSFLLIGLAALCFLQFLGSVRGALARAEGEPSRITTAAIVSGVAFITLAVSAHAVATVNSWTVSYAGSDYTVDPNTARMLLTLGYALFVMSLFPAAGLALAVATVAFQFRAFPAWLAWFSVLATVAGLLGALFFPSLVVLAWIAALSVYLLIAANRPAEATTTP
ncbi:MAG: hypothetical protein ACXWYS_04115 [Gaiellaceae bacterium]